MPGSSNLHSWIAAYMSIAVRRAGAVLEGRMGAGLGELTSAMLGGAHGRCARQTWAHGCYAGKAHERCVGWVQEQCVLFFRITLPLDQASGPETENCGACGFFEQYIWDCFIDKRGNSSSNNDSAHKQEDDCYNDDDDNHQECGDNHFGGEVHGDFDYELTIDKVFVYEDDAYNFYNLYARLNGFGIRKHWATRFHASNVGLKAIETDLSKSGIISLILWSIWEKVKKVIEDGMYFPSEIRKLNECLDSFLAEQAIRKNGNQLLNDGRLSQQHSDACISQVVHMHQISIREPAAPVKTKGRPNIATRLKSGLELAKEAKNSEHVAIAE
ncbi:hypothetical protein RJ640_012783 [Escallonia rubra]|uniref:Uncharacterized protein n=1 Tax=Escallonia rubra TaxID=112253 RepID=A0AA88RY02_9ASTE|nr:hypothetical protein RJ640_012783 [Escallonia rubra]